MREEEPGLGLETLFGLGGHKNASSFKSKKAAKPH